MEEISTLFTNFWPLIWGIIAVISLFTFTWVVSVILKNASIVDWIWGMGFVVQACVYISKDTYIPINYPRIIFSSLIIIHGLRLSIYIIIRGWSKGEDKRYKNLFRDKYGNKMWWISYFSIFLFQSILNLIIGFDIYTFNSIIRIDNINLGCFFFGSCLMLIGTVYETVADMQLYKFKKKSENVGKILDSGLWYYSRHPNYFGECVFWLGTYICNLSALIWFTFFSPLTIIFFILYVSGIPILEKSMENTHNNKYGKYVKTTSSFFPWFKYKDNQVENQEKHDSQIKNCI